MRETLVIDASVAVKWVVEEHGSPQAVALREVFGFTAPELLLAKCANILWKKSRRGEVDADAAALAGRLIEKSGVAFVPLFGMSEATIRLAASLGHPAYDCAYLALAQRRGLRFVTADRRLLAAVATNAAPDLKALCLDLAAFA